MSAHVELEEWITPERVEESYRLAIRMQQSRGLWWAEVGWKAAQARDPKLLKALEKATGFLRRELGKRLELRYVPEIIFSADPSFAYGSRIDTIFAQIREQEVADDPKDS